jgi:hypothetical protein
MFDYWREAYHDLPYRAHQLFYNMVAETFPHQDKADREAVESALIHASVVVKKPLMVWELGGWNGALARDMARRFGDDIKIWRNVEICETAIRHSWDCSTVPRMLDPYAPCIPSKWIWEYPRDAKGYHIAVLSHVIEHLSWEHLHQLLLMLDGIPWIYIQTPDSLGQGPHPTGWRGTMSTHKLEVGLSDVHEYLRVLNYSLVWRKCNAALYAHT